MSNATDRFDLDVDITDSDIDTARDMVKHGERRQDWCPVAIASTRALHEQFPGKFDNFFIRVAGGVQIVHRDGRDFDFLHLNNLATTSLWEMVSKFDAWAPPSYHPSPAAARPSPTKLKLTFIEIR